MGLCPMCGCFIEAGEPGCPECGFVGASYAEDDDEMISIEGREYSSSDVEDILDDYSYDLDDLEMGRIDEDDWQFIREDLDRL